MSNSEKQYIINLQTQVKKTTLSTHFDVVQKATLHCPKNTETFGHSFVDVDTNKLHLKNHTQFNLASVQPTLAKCQSIAVNDFHILFAYCKACVPPAGTPRSLLFIFSTVENRVAQQTGKTGRALQLSSKHSLRLRVSC